MREYGKQAQIEDGMHPHRLRHSFGYNLMQEGKHPSVIQALMRHASLNTTMRYGKATAEDMADAVDSLSKD